MVYLDEPLECWPPCAVGEPDLSGFLWVKQRGLSSGWRRRFVVLKANFVYWFAEKEAERASKPVGVLCFEDLDVVPIFPPPKEKDVSAFAQHAFQFQCVPMLPTEELLPLQRDHPSMW